jgi:hypothetical protein
LGKSVGIHSTRVSGSPHALIGAFMFIGGGLLDGAPSSASMSVVDRLESTGKSPARPSPTKGTAESTQEKSVVENTVGSKWSGEDVAWSPVGPSKWVEDGP